MKKRMMQLHAETCHYFEFSDTNDVWERLLHEHTLLRVPPPLRPACLPTIYCLKDNFQRRKRLNMKYLFLLSLVFVTHNCPFLPLPLLYPLFLTAENCAKHRLYKYTDSQTLLETQKSPVVQANEYEGKMEVVQHELPHCTATLNPDCGCV